MHKDDMNAFKGGFFALESVSRQCLFIGFSSCEAVHHSMEPQPERREGCSLKMKICQSQRQFVLKIVDLEARFFATEPNLESSAGTMTGLPTFLLPVFFVEHTPLIPGQ